METNETIFGSPVISCSLVIYTKEEYQKVAKHWYEEGQKSKLPPEEIWINIKDRIPTKEEIIKHNGVLAVNANNKTFYHAANNSDGVWWKYGDISIKLQGITHWRLLPNLPTK